MKGEIINIINELDEKYYYFKHKSGLDILLVPKNVSTSFAIIATRFGAIDNCFKTKKDKKFNKVPDGIAHYLEHKMFENEDGSDTMEKFAKYGAYDNAYTSSDMTAYHFFCTSYFDKNLEILLNSVTHPYYTDENVEKEQGIIGQEIMMDQDNPDRILYYNFLDSLYKKNNIKTDVLGSIESISKINKELLYLCYNTFYNMSNMVLLVHGNHTMDEIVKICDKVIPIKENVDITRKYNTEPNEVNKKRIEKEVAISKPLFIIGIKEPRPDIDKYMMLHKSIVGEMAYDLLFGQTSEFYLDMYEKGIVNRFYGGYDCSKIYSHGYLKGESDNPDKVYRLFCEYVEKVKDEGISKIDFERNKRANYASIIKLFDSYRIVSGLMVYLQLDDLTLEDYLNETKKVTYDDVMQFICEHFKEDMYTLTILKPIK